ncbi:MAG: phage tail protein [Acidobacteria bacterium]|nr:MAG: phage tail protein [Acidobacteriota bacterium]
MSSPFVAEIRMFAGNFAPTGWALCNGQLLPISQNTALFSLLGTNYGGDGKSTFALPNLEGSVPIGQGQSSASGTSYFIGEQSGVPNVTLLQTEMPAHTHNMMAQNIDPADTNQPGPQVTLGKTTPGSQYLVTNTNIVQMWPTALAVAGGSLPHNNMQPFLTVTFIIAQQGVFPPRG